MTTATSQRTASAAAEFIHTIHGNSREHLVLWRGDTKASLWTTATNTTMIDSFAAQAVTLNFDAYFGVCLQAKPLGKRKRGTMATVVTVPGVWADIDFHKEESEKKYPPRDVAERVLSDLPFAPTIIVESGGGLHAYWLFSQPFIITTEEERTRLKAACEGWQSLLRSRLLEYALDSTHDLTRVLRLPGSPHTKHPGFTVFVREHNGPRPRYELADIEREIDSPATASTPPPKGKTTNGTKAKPTPKGFEGITRDAEPPAKLVNLMEASLEFKAIWEGRTKRSSPSEYDMSLANFAINAKWTDGEAAKLLVAFARKWNPSHIDKLLRVTGGVYDYLLLTIGKAHEKRMEAAVDPPPANEQAGRAAEFISQIDNLDDPKQVKGARGQFIERYALTEKPESLGQEFDSDFAKERERQLSPLALIRKALRTPHLIAVRKLGIEDASIDLVFDDPTKGQATVTIGETYTVMNKPDFVQASLIGSIHAIEIPSFSKQKWKPIGFLIMKAAVLIETTDKTRQIAGIILEAMETFPTALEIEEKHFAEFVHRETRTSAGDTYQAHYSCVFRIKGESAVYINARGLIGFAGQTLRRNIAEKDLYKALHGMKFEQLTVYGWNEKKFGVRLWKGTLPTNSAKGD